MRRLPVPGLLGLLAGAAVALGGCGPRRTDPVRSGWTRGLPLAVVDVVDTPSLAATPQARWAAWTERAGGGTRLVVAQLDPDGAKVTRTEVPVPAGESHTPRLVSLEGTLLLLYLGGGGLHAQPLGPDGSPRGEPVSIVPPELEPTSYDVVATPAGLAVAWTSERAGVQVLRLDSALRPAGPPRDLAPEGLSPVLALDEAENLHVAWVTSPGLGRRDLRYAQLSPDLAELSGPWTLGTCTGGLGAVFSSPALSLDEGWVYGMLSVDYRGGPQAGTLETHLFAARRGNPEDRRISLLALPGAPPAAFEAVAHGLRFEPLGPDWVNTYVRAWGGYSYVHSPALAMVSVKLPYGRKAELQPAVVLLSEGQVAGWSPIASTGGLSRYGTLARSPEGWHALWLDMYSKSEQQVLYASTAPGEARWLNRFEWGDLGHLLLTFFSGLLAGFAAIPMFLLAAVPGLLLVAGHYVLGGEGDLRSWSGKVLFIVAASAYGLLKVALTEMLVPQFPFAAWMTPRLAYLLARVAPWAFLAAALAAVRRYWKRSDEPALLFAYGLLVGVDLLPSLLLIGPALGGA